MATLAVKEILKDTGDLSLNSAASGGDEFALDPGTILLIDNGTTAVQVTVTVQETEVIKDGYGVTTLSDIVVTISADTLGAINPPHIPYSDGNGKAQVSYDDVSNVSVLPIQAGN